MVNEFKKVYFRIETGYVWGEGHSEENRNMLKEEVRKIFLPLGFEIIPATISGACEEASRGKENLYLHPQNFSGLLKEENIAKIEEAIRISNVKLRFTDVYNTYYAEDESFLLEKFSELKESLKLKLLETFKTTRKNKFVALNDRGMYSPIKLVDEKLGDKVYRNFMHTLVNEMHEEGLLIKMNNDSESKYFRALNSNELKKWKSEQKKLTA